MPQPADLCCPTDHADGRALLGRGEAVDADQIGRLLRLENQIVVWRGGWPLDTDQEFRQAPAADAEIDAAEPLGPEIRGWAPSLAGPGLGVTIDPAAVDRITIAREALLG